jgi:two-component system response regulator FixJ
MTPLTPREQQVLEAVWAGQQNGEMAAQFGIAVRTVEVHRYRLNRKLQASNTAQLLRKALEAELIA